MHRLPPHSAFTKLANSTHVLRVRVPAPIPAAIPEHRIDPGAFSGNDKAHFTNEKSECRRLSACVSSKFTCWNPNTLLPTLPTPYLEMISGCRAFGKWLGHEGGALLNGVSALINDAVVKNPPTDAGDAGDGGLITGSGRHPGGGNVNLLQYSVWRNWVMEHILSTHAHSWKRPHRALCPLLHARS